MLAGCPLGTIFPPSPRVDLVKLPSIIETGPDTWRPRPRLFLADHMPAGVWGELLPALEMIKTMGPGYG